MVKRTVNLRKKTPIIINFTPPVQIIAERASTNHRQPNLLKKQETHRLTMTACCSSYFSIDQILADEEEIPVSFQTPSFLLGKELVIRNVDGERQAEVLSGSRTNMPL